MAEEVKFSEEELKTLNEIQDGYIQSRGDFGQLYMSRVRLNNQFEELDQLEADLNKNFEDLQIKEKKFLDETTKKYGQGSLNPETGVFTPTPDENTSDKAE
tara:strand:+ start:929 stop:1231 length:303 start_codon:yes stop_codon:yes gene_type:complete